jgi:DNA-binding IclR family transcriptional regulator
MKNTKTGRPAAAIVKSAERVLSVFEYFEKVRSPRTLSELSQDLNYPVSSALALLRSMQSMGYLDYNYQHKTYFPSIRFAMLGQWIRDRLFEGGAIAQMMVHLAAVTHETVLLGIQNGLQSQHIHIVKTSQSLSYLPPVGTLRPLLRSAVGRVLLSQQPRTAVLRIIEQINSSGLDEGRTFSTEEVLADLESIRRNGFAYSANVFTPGAAILAVALPPRASDSPMAISVGAPASRLGENDIPKLLAQIKSVIAEFLTDVGDDTDVNREVSGHVTLGEP